MKPLDSLSRAAAHYARALSCVGPTQWDQSSTCSGWTVKDLADHVLGGNRFAVALLAGSSVQDAYRAAFEGGFDGDPVEEFEISAAVQYTAFTSTGDLDRVLPHPAGDISARVFLGFRVGDLLLHGWDVARSVGADSTLDDELVEQVWHSQQPLRGDAVLSGHFGEGPSGSLAADAPLVDRLLDATGRRPA